MLWTCVNINENIIIIQYIIIIIIIVAPINALFFNVFYTQSFACAILYYTMHIFTTIILC